MKKILKKVLKQNQEPNEIQKACAKYGVAYNPSMGAKELAESLLVGFVDGMSVEDVLNKKEGK